MHPGKIINYLLILSTLILIRPDIAMAKCEQDFQFNSHNLEFSISGFYDQDNKKPFIYKINEFIPYVIDLSKKLGNNKTYIKTRIICQQDNKSSLTVSNQNSEEEYCDNDNSLNALFKFAELLNIKLYPHEVFKGFSLQLAYIKDENSSVLEKQRWRGFFKKLPNLSSLRIEGTCREIPLWIHQYENKNYAIRYGLFNTFKEVKTAIEALEIPPNNAQVVPINFKIEELKSYLLSR